VKSPVRLASTAYEKVWGSPHTEPWLWNPERRRIGEIWFAASDSVRVLVKLLFTMDNLSVQVHPQGKTEMWHILRAEPGARIALGVRETLTPERLRQASRSGEIVELLNWIPVRAGDTFFAPAGQIHAIGGGLALCEVQQPLDVTYRLYDYDRGRELHIEQGIAVSSLEPHEGAREAQSVAEGRELLAECTHFRTERLRVNGSVLLPPRVRNTIFVAMAGEGDVAGIPFRAGDAIEVPAGAEPVRISGVHATLIVTTEP
jgi:mannose-6-phosphate isomerase